MITKLPLIRNVSQFESVTSGADITLTRLALAYGENGRGKTTLAAIFRSLSSGDPIPILERHRFTAQHPPHIRIEHLNGSSQFQNGSWDNLLGSISVYDDAFVDENIYSGLSVDSEHRHNLHELIVGSQGVNLNQQLKTEVEKIEEHNKSLRTKATPITAEKRGPFNIDDFCRLPRHDNVDEAIKETQNGLEAGKQQEKIAQTPLLKEIQIPPIEIEALNKILAKNLADLEQEAAAKVQAHLRSIGNGGETWVADGIKRINPQDQRCPFCTQSLTNATIINHYRSYFSTAYKNLRSEIESLLETIIRHHGGEARAAFERSIRVLSDTQQFWAKFADIPAIPFNSIEISRLWRAAFDALTPILESKKASPLEVSKLSDAASAAIKAYNEACNSIADFNQSLKSLNQQIGVVKEKANAGDIKALEADLGKLKATKNRFSSDMDTVCQQYQVELAAKVATEQRRDKIREDLNQHQKNIFPIFNNAINDYLQKFNAGFRLSNIEPENTRGGTACTYNVVIYERPVPIGGGRPQDGQPGFKNTLSSGDRNTLALAFFFAMIDQDPNLNEKIVVIDDPMTSLDDHRTLTTVQEVRRLSQRVKQVIVLSHNKPFLCRIWDYALPTQRASMQITREGTGSTIAAWDVREDAITEYDRKHHLLRDYSATSTNSREVASAIRSVLEGYLRVACPEHFPPGTLLGPFRGLCEQRVGSQNEILNQGDIDELRNLTEYANKFHHDTNPAWETETINDGELLGFTERTLRFIKR